MGKKLLYPYSKKFSAFIDYFRKQGDEIILAAPRSWIGEGKDAGVMDNREEVGITVTNQFEEGLAECDDIFFLESANRENIEEVIYRKIELALKEKKKVNCIFKLDLNHQNKFASIAEEEGAVFHYLEVQEEKNFLSQYERCTQLENIDTPVIFVSKILNELNSSFVGYLLKEYFEENQYQPLFISQNRNALMIENATVFPEFFSSLSDLDDKIWHFNYYIKYLEMLKKPDVIIIELPDAICRYDQTYTNGCGTAAFMISQAVSPDFMLVCMPFGNLDKGYYEHTSSICQYRFSSKVTGYAMLNQQFDKQASGESMHECYNWLPIGEVNAELSQIKECLPIFNPFNKEQTKEFYDRILGYLQGSGF